MQDLTFYQSHLNQVSRSFAFCIQKLESPLRLWTSLSYLLCRTLDTIEDSNWSDPNLRDHQYSQFETFIVHLPLINSVEKWGLFFQTRSP